LILGCVVALGLGLGACSAASSVQGSLSDAIAGAEPGATLHIAPGRHEGSVVIDKPLTIVGEPGAIIVGTPGQPTISIVHTDNVTVRGLALEGGESGIYVLESENVVIDQVQVHDAEWHGIVAQDAEIEVLDCAVSGLLADRAQGIEIINSDRRPPSRVAGCRIEGPVFEGIVSHVSHVTFENNVVVGSSPRGIVVTEMSAGLMAGNHVSGATGAAYFCGDQSRCSVVDNSASGVAAGTPSYRSGMGHGLVVHFDSIAYVDGLQVDGAEGDQVLLMLDSRLSAVPLDLGFDRNGLPWTALLVVMAVLAVALLGGWTLTQGPQLSDLLSQLRRVDLIVFQPTRDQLQASFSLLPAVLMVFGLLQLLVGAVILAHRGWARWLGVLLALFGLLVSVVALIATMALIPGTSVQLMIAVVLLLGYAYVLLALFAGGSHFRANAPRR